MEELGGKVCIEGLQVLAPFGCTPLFCRCSANRPKEDVYDPVQDEAASPDEIVHSKTVKRRTPRPRRNCAGEGYKQGQEKTGVLTGL